MLSTAQGKERPPRHGPPSHAKTYTPTYTHTNARASQSHIFLGMSARPCKVLGIGVGVAQQ